ncbi:MAG: hypothetical protein RLZZ630_1386 [Bacteroidota bacterium]
MQKNTSTQEKETNYGLAQGCAWMDTFKTGNQPNTRSGIRTPNRF